MRLKERIAACYCTSYRVNMIYDRSNTRGDHVAYPERSKTEACYGYDKANHSKAFVPSSIGELEVMLVGASTIENLTYYTEDVDCGDYDGTTSSDGEHTMEGVCILERTYEDGHFSNES